MMVNKNLVGGAITILKNMSSSNGSMTFPTEWKNKGHVPNHQPDKVPHFIIHFCRWDFPL